VGVKKGEASSFKDLVFVEKMVSFRRQYFNPPFSLSPFIIKNNSGQKKLGNKMAARFAISLIVFYSLVFVGEGRGHILNG